VNISSEGLANLARIVATLILLIQPIASLGPFFQVLTSSAHSVAKIIQDDLSKERPAYYLSVYACQKLTPNIIDGTDLSPEELRYQAYQAKAHNTMAQYISNESQSLQQVDSVINLILQNTFEAYKHFYNHAPVALNHPTSTFKNTKPSAAFGSSAFGPTNQVSAFGKPTSAFGASSTGAFAAFSSQTTPSTASAFGQSSPIRPAVSAFGQATSAFGPSSTQVTTVSAFGKPSAFGTPVVSAFGTPTTSSAFSQPSKFGAKAFGTESTQPSAAAFGATSAFGANAPPAPSSQISAFGKASTLGQSTSSAFGQPSTIGQSPFGKPSILATSGSSPKPSQPGGAFGQSAFGASTVSAFGQPSTPTNTASNQSLKSGGFAAFAANSNPSLTNFGKVETSSSKNPSFGSTNAPSAFGQSSILGSSAFGKSSTLEDSTFGQSSTSGTSTFGQSSTLGTSAFGQSSTLGASAFGQSSTLGTTSFGQPSVSKVPAFGQPATGGASNASSKPEPASPLVQELELNPSYHPSSNVAENKFKLKDPWWGDAPKKEELPLEILSAFESAKFSWEHIPHVPPPLSLR
ncbi:hypothetical protein O181_033357, partial [Austropuccinia psidii MF-1]|nr:hypothetical protein [Austropuccinia psidii MF-1]